MIPNPSKVQERAVALFWGKHKSFDDIQLRIFKPNFDSYKSNRPVSLSWNHQICNDNCFSPQNWNQIYR